jgi:hypothetical protein
MLLHALLDPEIECLLGVLVVLMQMRPSMPCNMDYLKKFHPLFVGFYCALTLEHFALNKANWLVLVPLTREFHFVPSIYPHVPTYKDMQQLY